MVLYSSVGSELFLFYVFSDWWSSSFPGGVVGGWCVFSKIESGELFPVFLYHSQPFFAQAGRMN